jgi:hypothetical protein
MSYYFQATPQHHLCGRGLGGKPVSPASSEGGWAETCFPRIRMAGRRMQIPLPASGRERAGNKSPPLLLWSAAASEARAARTSQFDREPIQSLSRRNAPTAMNDRLDDSESTGRLIHRPERHRTVFPGWFLCPADKCTFAQVSIAYRHAHRRDARVSGGLRRRGIAAVEPNRMPGSGPGSSQAPRVIIAAGGLLRRLRGRGRGGPGGSLATVQRLQPCSLEAAVPSPRKKRRPLG